VFERRQLTPADLPDTLPEAGGRVFARRNPELAGASAPRNAAAEQRASRQAERVRIFLDSNLPTAATWGLDKAVLSLCAPRICRLVVIEAVRDEVEENLLVRLGGLATAEARTVYWTTNTSEARAAPLIRADGSKESGASSAPGGRRIE